MLVGGFNHLETYEFVNGKDGIPNMKWKIRFMFETTNQIVTFELTVVRKNKHIFHLDMTFRLTKQYPWRVFYHLFITFLGEETSRPLEPPKVTWVDFLWMLQIKPQKFCKLASLIHNLIFLKNYQIEFQILVVRPLIGIPISISQSINH